PAGGHGTARGGVRRSGGAGLLGTRRGPAAGASGRPEVAGSGPGGAARAGGVLGLLHGRRAAGGSRAAGRARRHRYVVDGALALIAPCPGGLAVAAWPSA